MEKPAQKLLFGDIGGDRTILKEVKGKELIFVTGPESGLTQNEVMALQKLDAMGVSLSENTLRTETASIVACGILALILQGK